MNQAAKALFFSGQEQPIEDLVGKSLAEFIVSLQASIGNLAQVERNLYLQSELLQSSNRPSPCNFEEIQFRSKRYGDLKLSKAGVAVRHPATGEILGWVVSFNIAEFGSQSSSAAYHKHHASVVENEIFAVPTGTAVPSETRTRSEDITWNEVACSSIPTEWQKSYSFRLAEGYSEKKKCFDYAITLMLKDRRRYGLTSVRHLPESFFDFERTEYLIVDHSEGILGVCRITLDYDVSEFTGSSAVLRQVSELSSTKSFADVGAYFNTSIKGPQRRMLVGKCLGAVMHISERNKCPYQYVQVPTPLRQVFRSFGFVEVGDSFRCTGWGDFRWVPMLTSPFWITGKTQPPSTGGGTIDVNDREYVEIVLGSYNSPESLLTNWEP